MKKKSVREWIEIVLVVLLCVFTLVADFVEIPYSSDEFTRRMISKIVQQLCGTAAGIWFMARYRIKLFGRVTNGLYLIPCFIIALDNFQWSAYFHGEMELVRSNPTDFLLFFGYCLSIGLFEEMIFRGILFSVLAGSFSKDRKGFLQTYVVSSLIFGAAHLFNGFSFGTILQVGYTILTGGLFAFCLIKTKNIFCCALVHGVYNFCGLLFDPQGMGTGVVFDLGTVLTMLVVSVAIGVFVLYKVWKYSDEERKELYERLGVSLDEPTKDEDNKTETV